VGLWICDGREDWLVGSLVEVMRLGMVRIWDAEDDDDDW
jgi:hypothetical protein